MPKSVEEDPMLDTSPAAKNRAHNRRLHSFFERIERLEEEKKGIADDIKDIYTEAKSQGYDTKVMRYIAKLRKMDKQSRDELDALIETYRAELGM